MFKTILCVDSSPDQYKILKQALHSEGYQFLISDRREEVLCLIQDERPDLILLEILLPNCDGFDLLQEIRGLAGDCSEVPVVITTHCERTAEDYSSALELGAKDFITKRIPEAQLIDTVREQAATKATTPPSDPLQSPIEESQPSALAGNFKAFPFPSLLHQLHCLGATGVLICGNANERVGIQLRNGSPIAARSSLGFDPIEAYLVATRRITEEEADTAKQRCTHEQCLLTEILIDMGAISANELEGAQHEQAEEKLLTLFGWEIGRYEFHKGKALNNASALEITTPAAGIILKGITNYFPAERISKALRADASLYIAETPSPHYSLDESGLSSTQRKFLENHSSEQSLSEFLEEDELVHRMLYGLVVTEFLEFQTSPTLMLLDEVEEGEEADEAPPVEKMSGSEIVPKAEIASLSEALTAEDENSAERALEAEGWFRKGESSLKRKQYPNAVEAFGMAAHLDPDEGEYLSHLGYALFLDNPEDHLVQREAQEHLAKGIKLSPNREKSFLFLGRIYKTIGKEDVACKMFRRALRVKPDYHEALQELRIINLRASKQGKGKKGLLGRIFKS